MCGFLAMIGDRWVGDFDAALDALAHRGPDDRGTWSQQDVKLGHRRLSVIDLTDAGHQPMISADERYVIAFNGEIYNHVELRDQLQRQGVVFRGRSDTEVLLEALAHGPAEQVLGRLDGMFGFALWDRAERTMLIARDRFGIKPLFYSTIGGFVAGSTLGPWWRLGGFPRRLDYQALRDYLAADCIFAPHSILRDVRALEPGCWLKWHADAHIEKQGRFYDIPPANDRPSDFEELVERADHAIAGSVRRQMIADVPLGAFLSGGIDSSLMTHYMAAASDQPVRTFSVRFSEAGAYDESRFARMIAERYHTEHHEFEGRDITADALLGAASHLDQPLADPALLPTLAISELTRRHVTVAISGDGGDELFGGYPRFSRDEHHWPDAPRRRVLSRLDSLGLLPGSLKRRSLAGKQRLLWDRLRMGPYRTGRKAMANLLAPRAYEQCQPDHVLRRWRDLCERWTGTWDTDALMRADVWTYLTDNCLTKTDRAAMRYALEVRVPLLGNAVADLILPEPASVKLTHGLKSVLKALADRHLPREAWDRPKHGFSVPLRQYFTGAWRETGDALVNETCRNVAFLQHQKVVSLWRGARRGHGSPRVMFSLLMLLAWLDAHRVDD